MTPIIEELEREFAGRLEVMKINVDEEPATAEKYGVMSIPTYIIEKDGREIDRLIGARPREPFKSWVQSRL